MNRLIRRENVKHYQDLLETVKDEAERQEILKLLAEERQRQKNAGDMRTNSVMNSVTVLP